MPKNGMRSNDFIVWQSSDAGRTKWGLKFQAVPSEKEPCCHNGGTSERSIHSTDFLTPRDLPMAAAKRIGNTVEAYIRLAWI